MKKIMPVVAAFILLLGLSGQAMAYFEDGDLIRVVYSGTGSGTEYATDLGNFSTLTSTSTANVVLNTDNFSLSYIGDPSWDQVYVAYFMLTGTAGGFPGNDVWTSGPLAGQTGGGRNMFSQFTSGEHSVAAAYQVAGGSAASAALLQSNPASYWNIVNWAGSGRGQMIGFIPAGNADQNMADASTTGYVDQYLYFYGTPNAAHPGTQIVLLRTYALGYTEMNPAPPVTYTVQTNISGTVSAGSTVTIASDIGGLSCTWNGSGMTGTCTTAGISGGTKVVLTAALPAGTTIEWGTGCDIGTATTCTISSIGSNMTISPVTSGQTFPVTVSGAGVNGGTMVGGAINATWDGSTTGGVNSQQVLYGGGPISIVATGNMGIYVTWSGDCSSTAGNGTGTATCTIEPGITADKNLTATFADAAYPVRRFTTVPTGYYTTIQDAYNNAADGESIQALAQTFAGDLNLNQSTPIAVKLQGGFDPGFTSNTGYTTVNGTLTILTGTATMEGIVVQ